MLGLSGIRCYMLYLCICVFVYLYIRHLVKSVKMWRRSWFRLLIWLIAQDCRGEWWGKRKTSIVWNCIIGPIETFLGKKPTYWAATEKGNKWKIGLTEKCHKCQENLLWWAKCKATRVTFILSTSFNQTFPKSCNFSLIDHKYILP